jgi:nucleoside 2-deoxyribosyltransferase
MSTKKVFVACPIGSQGSPERERSNKLLKFVIEPVVSELGCEVIRADGINEPGRITLQIAKHLGSTDVVIADLTDLNANVMYELGVRQGLGRPFILMAERGQNLPFDLLDVRTIFYELSLEGVEQTKAELKKQMKATLDGKGDVIDRALFAAPQANQSAPDNQDLLLNLIESNGRIIELNSKLIRDSEETKGLLQAIGQIIVELRESKNQEMGLQFFSSLMEQGIQNPDGFTKFITFIQSLQQTDDINQSQQENSSVEIQNPQGANSTKRRTKKQEQVK